MDKTSAASGQDWSRWLMDPAGLGAAAVEYAVDSWQRTLLYADVRRERGNQYREHLRERAPNVLGFEAEPVLSGLDLQQPLRVLDPTPLDLLGHAVADVADE